MLIFDGADTLDGSFAGTGSPLGSGLMWSMPHRILRIVAGLIGLCAVGGFALGLISSNRGPSPDADEPAGAPAPLVAADAQPLDSEAPPAPEPRAQAKAEADETDSNAQAKVAAAEPEPQKAPPAKTPPVAPAAAPPADKVGDLIDAVTPPPEEPPH